MQRILVIGSGGAGKTTVAKEIAARLGLPLIHLDRLFWSPGWVPAPDEEWDRTIARLAAQDQWVMDGNYGRTQAARLAACDTVVFLDLPPWLCLWRVTRRWWRYRGRSRPDLPEGCDEQVNFEFFWWIATFRRRRRPGILARLAELRPDKTVVVLRSTRDVERFLAGLSR